MLPVPACVPSENPEVIASPRVHGKRFAVCFGSVHTFVPGVPCTVFSHGFLRRGPSWPSGTFRDFPGRESEWPKDERDTLFGKSVALEYEVELSTGSS